MSLLNDAYDAADEIAKEKEQQREVEKAEKEAADKALKEKQREESADWL